MRAAIYILALSTIFLASCVSDQLEHPFAGTYDCEVTHHYWDINGTNTFSTEVKHISVTLSNDSVEVLGSKIAQDELEYGQSYFFGVSYNHMTVRFEPDSIFISSFSGGLGGGTSTSYKGRKLN